MAGGARTVNSDDDDEWSPGPDLLAQLLFTPLVATWSIWVAMAISARSSDFRVAQQLSTLASLPSVVVAALISFDVIHATLGLAIAPSRAARRMRLAVGLPEREGILVRGVEEGGPADRAGIERGDLIVAAAGSPVTGVDDLYEALDRAESGASLELGLVHGTDGRSVVVSFADDAEGE